MANNFTTILWNKFIEEFQTSFSFPKELAISFLQQTYENIKEDPKNAISGPLLRKDIKTIEKNLKSLENDSFKSIYAGFVRSCLEKDHVRRLESLSLL